MCSDARGRRYTAAAFTYYSRPRHVPHRFAARYRRPATKARCTKAIICGPTRRCGCAHAHGPPQQHPPPPSHSAYRCAATAARSWAGAPCARLRIHSDPASTTACLRASPNHRRPRVRIPTSEQPMRLPACWLTHPPNRPCRHSFAGPPACLLTQLDT